MRPSDRFAYADLFSDIDGIELIRQRGNGFLHALQLRKDVYERYLVISNLASLNFTARYGNGMSTLGVLYPHHSGGVSYNISRRGFLRCLSL